MKIEEFRETSRISLQDVILVFPDFVIPGMYYYLDGSEFLKFIEDNIEYTGLVKKAFF